jgi:glycerol-3-phosphate dehydrogenase (NAD(P)+)
MNISIIGAGSWGTTLALVLHQNGHQVYCWAYEKSIIEDITETGMNNAFLPGIAIPADILFYSDLNRCLEQCDAVVLATPAQAIRSVLVQIQSDQLKDIYWITVAKGIEKGSLKRISEVIHEVCSIPYDRIGALSGPSHAEEVSRKIPTAVVAASPNTNTAAKMQRLFNTGYFRVYTNTDLLGVELGGALKNIIALAAGICDGAGYGDNTKAALMTRGLVEIGRLGIHLGAKPDTFAGLSGMGDLIVTCMSKHSRNRFVGQEIGRGAKLPAILAKMVMVAEGVETTKSAYELARREGIEIPITEQVYQVLYHNKPPRRAVKDLMTRQSKSEHWG